MKTTLIAIALFAAVFSGVSSVQAKTAAELEKEKAMQNPYPNDFGPGKLDEAALKSYPADKQEGYKLMQQRCAQCHTPARPLNSRFVEPDAGDKVTPANRDAMEGEALKKMQGEHPEYFKDSSVWQIEASIWNRYVKRMLSKPGCGIDVGGKMTTAEAGKIYKFLVYDGQRRKLGANAEKWKAHRLKLIEELKTKNLKRYEELKSQNDL